MRALLVILCVVSACGLDNLEGGDDISGGGNIGGGGADGPNMHSFGSPSLIAVSDPIARSTTTSEAGALRIALTTWQTDSSTSTIELGTLAPGATTISLAPIELDDPHAIAPELGTIDGHELLVWSEPEDGPTYAAPLEPDGTIDRAGIVAFGDAYPTLARIGDRYRVTQDIDGAFTSEWLSAEGVVEGPLDLALGSNDQLAAMTNDPDGTSPTWAYAVWRPTPEGTGPNVLDRELRVTRVALDGTVVDDARLVATPSYAQSAIAAATPDGGVLLFYDTSDEDNVTVHAVRVTADGTSSDIVTAMTELPHGFIVHGDRAFAIRVGIDDPSAATYGVTAYVLDLDGNVLGTPVAAGSSSFGTALVATPEGYAFATDTPDNSVALQRFDANGALAGAQIAIATSSTDGCNSGGGDHRSAALAVVLAGYAISRPRSSENRTARSSRATRAQSK